MVFLSDDDSVRSTRIPKPLNYLKLLIVCVNFSQQIAKNEIKMNFFLFLCFIQE